MNFLEITQYVCKCTTCHFLSEVYFVSKLVSTKVLALQDVFNIVANTVKLLTGPAAIFCFCCFFESKPTQA